VQSVALDALPLVGSAEIRLMTRRSFRKTPAFLSFAFFALALATLGVTKILPYASCLVENASVPPALSDPTHSFVIGSIRWDVDAYARDPQLQPFRDFFHKNCLAKTGTGAAICVSQVFAAAFPLGMPQRDFYDRNYNPLIDFRRHMAGEPGHCVNRSGLLATMLLSVGIPARVVAIVPLSRTGGHTVVGVWDGAGWQIVDSTANGLLWSPNGTSATDIAQAGETVRLVDPLTFRKGLYQYESAIAGNEVVYPEPWLYTRTGNRFSFWPFRGRFVQVGMQRGHFATPLLWMRMVFLLAFLCGIVCLVICFVPLQVHQEMKMQPEGAEWYEAWRELVCPRCARELSYLARGRESWLACAGCQSKFPIINRIPRLLLNQGAGPTEAEARTAASFGFEWSRFSEMYPQWEQNFLYYMAPHAPSFFHGKKVLDAGCGNGRHSYYAAKYGAEVWAVDASQAADVAARNTGGCRVNVVQADLNHLPFAPHSFDLVYSLGVLHHLADPEASLRYLLRFLKPDGEIRVFLYWNPVFPSLKHTLLATVTFLRQLTTRLPHRVVYTLSYVAATVAWVGFVWPYRVLRTFPRCQRLAEGLPMRQYSRYPFRTCVNDQFDRFSAPIERRYTRAEVEDLFRRAGREDVTVRQNFGWVASSSCEG